MLYFYLGYLLDYFLAIHYVYTLLQSVEAVAYILAIQVIYLTVYCGVGLDVVNACGLVVEVQLGSGGVCREYEVSAQSLHGGVGIDLCQFAFSGYTPNLAEIAICNGLGAECTHKLIFVVAFFYRRSYADSNVLEGGVLDVIGLGHYEVGHTSLNLSGIYQIDYVAFNSADSLNGSALKCCTSNLCLERYTEGVPLVGYEGASELYVYGLAVVIRDGLSIVF